MKDVNERRHLSREVLESQNEMLQSQVQELRKHGLMVADAHQAIMFKLFALTQEGNDDPEKNASEVEEAVKEYFSTVGYSDIVMFLDQIKTYY